MRRFLYCLLLFVLSVSAQNDDRGQGIEAAPTVSEQRVALVIGNASYGVRPLRNPVNDARAMRDALTACGFTIIYREDCDRTTMFKAVREFGDAIAKGGVGLFYYAGHGVQAEGDNYLVPVNVAPEDEDEVKIECLAASLVLGKMEQARNRVNILLLDACRENPFGSKFRTLGRGLAPMDSARGAIVAYATAPGSVAADGEGDHGLFTEKLLARLREPGVTIEQLLKNVRIDVYKASGEKQLPWTHSSLIGDFYFVPAGGKVDVTPPPPTGPILGGPIIVSQLPAELRQYGSLVTARMDAGKLTEARDIATTLLNQPDLKVDDPTWTWAVNAIGQINTRLLFGPEDCPEKIDHRVERGDSVSQLATRYGTTYYALQKGNGMTDSDSTIRIGQILRVYKAQWRIHISKSRSVLTLYDGDRIFKAYRVGLGKQYRTPVGEFRIVDKVTEPAWRNIKYGEPGNILGTRWIGIRATGSTAARLEASGSADLYIEAFGIHGTGEPDRLGERDGTGMVRMSNKEIEDLFDIVPYQTPIIIED